MFSFSSSRRHTSKQRGGTHPRVAPRSRPSVEALEDRCLLSAGSSAIAETLYIGDGGDNTVKMFDASTGAYEGTLFSSGSGGLNGPRGLIFRNDGQLLLVDQNVNEPNPGEVLRFNGITGGFLGDVVNQTDTGAPFAPRGMVLGDHHILYVGDDGNLDGITLGRLTRFNSEAGAFLGDLQPSGFTGDFYPRGVVIGPDGLVYAAVRNIAATGGEIMRWDPTTGKFLGSFVTGDATNDLNRPEGLVFGPDGNLYVASFRADASDTDKLLEFNGQTGAYIGKIDLDQVGQPRAFGEALLFGPGGKLFVPITGNGPDTGEVRRYDVSTGSFDMFVPPNASGGPLEMPWYLSFRDSDPATLAYSPGPPTAASHSTMPAAPTNPNGLFVGLGTFLVPPTPSSANMAIATSTAASADNAPSAAPPQFLAATGMNAVAAASSVPTRSTPTVRSLVDRVFADVASEL